MGRVYTITFEEVAVTAVQDLFEVVAAADSVVIIHELRLSQSSDAGDTESEQLQILMHRGSTSGSGGTAPTPSPIEVGDSAFGGTAEVNNTSQSTEGTILGGGAWNVMAGEQFLWTPETRLVLSPSGRFIVELQTAPDDSLTMTGTLTVEEIGG
jgi:hypothetical protein